MCVIGVVVGPCPEKFSLGAVDVAAGVFFAADFSSVFWCVEVKSDSGRRDSNPGSERSQPKTLTTYFYLCLLIPGFLHIFIYTIFFLE